MIMWDLAPKCTQHGQINVVQHINETKNQRQKHLTTAERTFDKVQQFYNFLTPIIYQLQC